LGNCFAAMISAPDHARACYRESERLAAEIHTNTDRARTLRAWAQFEHTQGNLAEAQSLLAQAKTIFTQLGMEMEAQRCSFVVSFL
jgi:hypothetical protein